MEERRYKMIINLQNYDRWGQVNNFMSWAADAYIIKSSDLTELKNKIKELLTKETEVAKREVLNT